ncbi:MAG: PDDEXK nuclease domain-containing protein [Butyrivibrio sp.]|nr:PDDEXK nuclease domain-containing protein [Ruminococcus flavefaciens]MCM1561411.1 PDDEXK nuclease domain-containing protein [Butyrivibrio sp.]
MEEKQKDYTEAVRMIKEAILSSQYEAGKMINGHQLMLYYGIGKYISTNSREGFWGKGAIDFISDRLDKELPGLRGFSARNLRYMRTFYEEWAYLEQDNLIEMDQIDNLELTSAKIQNNDEISIWNLQVPKESNFPMEEFLSIGFTHHRTILSKVKDKDARLFYIRRCYDEKFNVESLSKAIMQDDYHHQGSLPNNFLQTLPTSEQAFRAISTFKDEYLLDYINVEELGIRDREDIDEKVVENAIMHNIKNFILTFGKDFTFVRNQYHLDAFGEDQFIDLLFFNRALNCLVAVELKTGKFKTSYLGQLSGYLSILDEFEKKAHENPSIGIILCKDMNKAFVDFVIRDYSKPMGVATYKTSADMSEELKKALPDIEELKKMLENDER